MESKDYSGIDLNPNTGKTADKRDSADGCQALCNETPGCKYFVWNIAENACWLKSSLSGKYDSNAVISGTACKSK